MISSHVPVGQTKPNEPAESSTSRCQWAVCPHPHDPVRKPEWFERKEDAENWRDEVTIPASPWQHEKIRRRDEGWHFLVPISWLTHQEGQPYGGKTFADFMPVDQVGASQAQDIESDLDEIFDDRDPKLSCDLGTDWQFEGVRSDAQKQEGHAFQGRKIDGIPHQLIRIAYDLEISLNRRNPNLSAQAIAMFWTSWPVWHYFNGLSARVGNEVAKVNPYAIALPGHDGPLAVAFVLRQVWFYAQQVKAWPKSSAKTGAGLELARLEGDPVHAQKVIAARRQGFIMPILGRKRWSRGKWVTKAGVSKNCVYEYLTGRRNPSASNRKAMAEVLGLALEDLPD